jgi:hypothetical protein
MDPSEGFCSYRVSFLSSLASGLPELTPEAGAASTRVTHRKTPEKRRTTILIAWIICLSMQSHQGRELPVVSGLNFLTMTKNSLRDFRSTFLSLLFPKEKTIMRNNRYLRRRKPGRALSGNCREGLGASG